MPVLKKTIFRDYDIRGRESDDELNDISTYHIARGFGALLYAAGIFEAIVGNDERRTSRSFHDQAVRALIESGIQVTDIGTVTTPVSSWAQFHFDIPGLFMVTASHNPAGWNGMKLGKTKEGNLTPAESDELYGIIERESYVTGEGSVRREDIADLYYADLLKHVSIKKPFKVLINTGNGTAGRFAPELFRRAGCEVVEHYTKVDPTYPHYTANPDGTEMMEDTARETVKNGCAIGLAFDGDADRLGVTDEKGNIIWPDRYLILLARRALAKRPGASIVFDVKVSEALPEDIKAHGGVPVMCRTGRTFIREKLKEVHGALGGEMSGHVFIHDGFYGFDDGFFAALTLLEYLAHAEKSLSELIAETPYYVSTPTLMVPVPDDRKFAIADQLVKSFADEGLRMVTLSGARVYFPEGWGLVRASSTTPALSLRFEARDKAGLARIRAVFEKKLKEAGVQESLDASGA